MHVAANDRQELDAISFLHISNVNADWQVFTRAKCAH